MTEFTDNKRFMVNVVKFHSDLVQLLVRKYLEEKHKGIPVFMYPELTNDIDVFNNRIETIKEIHDKLASKKPLSEKPKTVQAFLDVLKERDEVKHVFKLKNIRQLIDNGIKYPENTQVELILVPSDSIHIEKDDDLYKKVERFNALRESYLKLEEEKQKQIMNVITHDTVSLNKDFNNVLNKLMTNIPYTLYSSNIQDKQFEYMHYNFSKLQIRVISMEELSKVSIDTEYIMKLLFPFDL